MDWQTLLLGALGTILTGLLTWAVERLIAFLNTKIKNEKALGYITDAVCIVTNAVKATYQSYVQSLKDKDIFTTEAQQTALAAAVNQAQSQMSIEVKNYIEANFGDITEWIKSQIEAALYDLKKQ